MHKEYELQLKNKSELKNSNSSKIKELINFVPIVTLHTPQDWKYQSLQIVSAQSVTGTGVITEIASSWTDFFGMESGRYNEKLKTGEDNCKSILRFQALQMGGNAILGADIDYSEAGAGKGMLMVCMAGTAVKITNLRELNYNEDALNDLQNRVAEIREVESELNVLSKYESLHSDYAFLNKRPII
nr:heavy metal-binding domain-containing protein [Cytophagales bacterium]